MWVVQEKPSIEKIVSKLKELRQLHEGNNKADWRALNSAFVGFMGRKKAK